MSATHGVWMPPTGCPPSMPLMLSVACRAPGGTTGTAVVRHASRGAQFALHTVEHDAHVVDRADAEERHAAVRDAAARQHLEPVDAAVADADAVDVQRLGDDDVVGPLGAETPVLREPRDAGKAAALFVHGAADFDRAIQLDAGAADAFDGKERRGDAGLHVARAAAVDPAVDDLAAERIERPAVAGRHDVEVAVQVHDRVQARVHAGCRRR